MRPLARTVCVLRDIRGKIAVILQCSALGLAVLNGLKNHFTHMHRQIHMKYQLSFGFLKQGQILKMSCANLDGISMVNRLGLTWFPTQKAGLVYFCNEALLIIQHFFCIGNQNI